jgi:hypothetical protein
VFEDADTLREASHFEDAPVDARFRGGFRATRRLLDVPDGHAAEKAQFHGATSFR